MPAVVLAGVIWGVWHTPLLLLGYNYPTAPGGLAVLLMCGFCTGTGTMLAWVRMRSGSVYAPAIGHGAVNAMAGSYVLFSDAAYPVSTVQASALGWSGWIIPFVVGAVLIVRARWTSHAPRPAGPAGSPAA